MSDDARPDGGTGEPAEARTGTGAGITAVGELTDPEPGHDHEFPGKGSIRCWFVTTNHRHVDILCVVSSLFFLLFGGMLALLATLGLTTAASYSIT